MRRVASGAELAAALELRRAVFCEEQGVALEADRDGLDDRAEHVVAVTADGRVVGTLRLLIDGPVARLGRMAVARSERGRGTATRMLAVADRIATAHGVSAIVLHAQLGARAVYRRAGFEPRGAHFLEEGIEHVTMEKPIATGRSPRQPGPPANRPPTE